MTVWKRPVERIRKLYGTLNADGNDIENVGSLSTEDLNNARYVFPDYSSEQINDEIETAESEGTNVVFAPGTYELSEDTTKDLSNSAMVVVRDGVSLFGYGVKIVAQDSANVIYADFDEDTGGSVGHDVTVAGFEIDGNKDNTTDDTASHPRGNGILFYGNQENVTVRDCEVYDTHEIGIHLDAVIGTVALNNTVRNTDNIGMHFGYRGSGNPTGPRKSYGAFNHFENVQSVSLSFGEARQCGFIGNTVEGSATSLGAVNVSGRDLDLTDNIVRDCAIGIEVDEQRFGQGASERINISGGSVVNTSNIAIRLDEEESVEDITIRDVKIEDCSYAVRAWDTDGLTTSGLMVESSDSPAGAIQIQDSVTDYRSEGDTVRDADSWGFIIESPSATVSGVTVDNTGTHGLRAMADGIRVESPTVKNTASDGIRARGDNVVIVQPEFINIGGNDIGVFGGAADVNLASSKNLSVNVGDGIRTRWGGVISGGVLDGIDLDTVTGQFDGDKALSKGTTGVDDYIEAVWTGSAWQPTDGGDTVTPT